MTTLITVINPSVTIDSEWVEILNAKKLSDGIYLTSFSLVNAKNLLYGAGYNCNEVLISKLDAICCNSLKSSKII